MKEDTSNLRGQLKEHEDEIQDPRENTMRTKNRVLQLYQEEAPSLMAAAVHSDEITDDLPMMLQERWKTSQATIKKHRRRFQNMHDTIESER